MSEHGGTKTRGRAGDAVRLSTGQKARPERKGAWRGRKDWERKGPWETDSSTTPSLAPLARQSG